MKKIFEFLKKLFFKKHTLKPQGQYYISGSDTLPPPLSKEEEEEALLGLARGDDASRNLLIERNLRLVVYISKKFETSGVYVEDLISIGTIGLIKAINTFNGDKNIKLATYASRCIENEILMYLRKNSSQKLECSLDEPLNIDWDGNELLLSDVLGTDGDEVSRDIETDEEHKLIREAVNALNDRERLIVNLRFGLDGSEGKTQKEVADMLGISQSYISRLEKKIIDRMRRDLINCL